MKAALTFTIIILIGLVAYTVKIKMELDQATNELSECTAELIESDSLMSILTEPGYTAVVNIPKAYANKYSDYFKATYSAAFDSVEGGVITKSAFEDMFSMNGVNAIAYKFAIDTSSTILPGKPRGLFLVLIGGKMDRNDNGTYTLTTTSNSMYYPNNWCPTNCPR